MRLKRSVRSWVYILVCCVVTAFLNTNNLYANDLHANNSSVNANTDTNTQSRWISAISSDNIDALSEIFNNAGSNSGALITLTASNGKTALMVACKQGDATLAKSLVAAGANIRAKTITDGTAFMFAVLGDQKPLAEWLMGLGADINAQGSNGWTSVMIAAAKGLDDTLTWLIDAGANTETPDVYGFTPLMRAVDNNHNDSVVRLLNVESADVHWQDEVANTALHYAVANQNIANIKQLISAGAKPLIKNLSGDTPWSMADTKITELSADENGHAVSMQIKSLLQDAITLK